MINKKAAVTLFWSAKQLIEQGRVKEARRMVEEAPGPLYEYAVDQMDYGEWGPLKRLFRYVFRGIDPNPNGNQKGDMARHIRHLQHFDPDSIPEQEVYW